MNTLRPEDMKEHYNVKVPQKSGDQYEYDRWFKSPEMRSGYEMTRKFIARVLKDVTFSSCFELGPGAGTWTTMLCAHSPSAHIDALDISSQMLKMAKEKTHDSCSEIAFIEDDFLTYEPTREYELFFSSRVIEYMVDKQRMAAQVSRLLSSEGTGILITKHPRYWVDRLRGKDIPEIHKHQVSPKVLAGLFKDAGLEVVSVYPVVLTFPLFHSATLHNLLYSLLGSMRWNFLHPLFCESYGIIVRKP